MRFPVVKGPLGCKRLRQDDVLPDITEVSEVRVRHARTSLRSRFGFPPPARELRSRGPLFGNVTRTSAADPVLDSAVGGDEREIAFRPVHAWVKLRLTKPLETC